MKTVKFITVLALVTIFMFNNQELKAQETENKITITYKGRDVTDNFMFEDSRGNPINFHDLHPSFESETNLYNNDLIGKRFVVIYKWVDVMLFDRTGVANGKTMKVKRIFKFFLK